MTKRSNEHTWPQSFEGRQSEQVDRSGLLMQHQAPILPQSNAEPNRNTDDQQLPQELGRQVVVGNAAMNVSNLPREPVELPHDNSRGMSRGTDAHSGRRERPSVDLDCVAKARFAQLNQLLVGPPAALRRQNALPFRHILRTGSEEDTEKFGCRPSAVRVDGEKHG